MTEVAKFGTFDHFAQFYVEKLIGSRSFLRLTNSMCSWYAFFAEKTEITMATGWTLKTDVLSKKFIKPLDALIYVPNAIAGGLALREKCYLKVKEAYSSNQGFIRKAIEGAQHGLKFIGEASAALRFLAAAGLIVLLPYKTPLTLFKNGFTAASAVLGIACEVHNIYIQTQKNPLTDEEKRLQDLKVMSSMLMLSVYTCSFFLNTFGGLDAAFGSKIPPQARLSPVIFNTWATLCSGSSFANEIVKAKLEAFKNKEIGFN